MNNKIKRVDLCIMKTILDKANIKGKSKRTNLALECKIPYHRFIKYMQIMILLNLLRMENMEKETFISITNLGKNFLNQYSCS